MDHRPYPKPDRNWGMRQRWHDLCFMHWRVPEDALRALLPPNLELDLFEGSAWLAVVPFHMSGIAPRFAFPLPWISAFAELNVRTYVRCQGRPGVWFFSLDAENPLAVRIARSSFHLPYMDARMQSIEDGEAVVYRSVRTHRGEPAAELCCRYQPTGAPFEATSNSLEDFLTSRYCLYATDPRGTLYRGEIDHDPWPLQPATVKMESNTMAAPLGFSLGEPESVLFVKEIPVHIWYLDRLGA